MSVITSEQKEPTVGQRWLYSLANFGMAIIVQTVGFLMLYYYVDTRHLPAEWYGIVLVIYSIYDAANNPVLGYLSDRTRSRWGRRIPYIKFGAVPYVVLFALLWMAPFDGLTQPVALLIYMVVVSWLWEGVSTAVSTGYYSLLPEMFTTYSSRTAVAVSMNIVQTIGLLVAFAVPPFLYGSEALGEYGWVVLGVSFGVAALIVIYVGLRGMFERPGYAGETTLPLGKALKATFNNRSFVTVVLAQTFRFVGTNALAAATPLFIKYTLQVDESGTAAILATAFITAAAVLWFWKKFVAERLEPRSTLMLANAVMVLAVIPTAFAQTLTVAVIGAAGLGIGLAGLILMGDVIVADVIDEDEVKTGHRREGMYFGMSKFIMTLSNAIVGLVFLAITALYGYDESIIEVAQQAPTVAMGFRVFMAAPVIGGSILAIIALFFYPLYGERLRAVKETLAARHAGEADASITAGGS